MTQTAKTRSDFWIIVVVFTCIGVPLGWLMWRTQTSRIDSKQYAEVWLWRELAPDLATPIDAAMSDGEITGSEYDELRRHISRRPDMFEDALKRRRNQAP